MARVVVLGGGFGGAAAAARLAKLGHGVTLLEAADRIGGALGFVEQDGFRWDSGPTATLLPAVVRDLFRKSGRPLEREIDLVPVEPARRFRFADGSVVDFPAGSRSAQMHALDEAFGAGAGARWTGYVDGLGEVWEVLRSVWFEQPWTPETVPAQARKLLQTRLSLQKSVHKQLRDPRLRQIALHHAVSEGQDPRNVPAWVGVWSYVEQTFGSWTVPGGMGALSEAMADRLGTRGVEVLTGTEATDLVVREGRVVAVESTAGQLDADHVVCAIDPRRLPALAGHVDRTMPAIPPTISHIGVVGEVPELPQEVVLHGEAILTLRTNGTAPDGAHAWTLLGRGNLAEDIVTALARGGIRVRDQVEVRVDRSPRELAQAWRGSPFGVLWQGSGTLRRRIGPRTPIDGVYQAGAHGVPGAGLAAVGLSAAQVATLIGPAER